MLKFQQEVKAKALQQEIEVAVEIASLVVVEIASLAAVEIASLAVVEIASSAAVEIVKPVVAQEIASHQHQVTLQKNEDRT